MDEAVELKMIGDATDILTKHIGRRPLGWMGPWIAETLVTPDLLKESGVRVCDGLASGRPAFLDEN